MARDVLITPASGLIDFLDTAVSKATITLGTDGILVLTGGANPIVIETSTAGSSALKVDGTNGTLFEVVDDLSGSLMSVNDAAGLPIFEVFADNHIVAGRYGQNDFYLDTSGNVGINNPSPTYVLDVTGTARFTGKTSVGNSSRTAMLDVRSDTGEAFRVDVAGAAYRIVANQTGVNLQGTVNLATLASSSSNSVLTENSGNIEKRTINSGAWGTLTGSRIVLTDGSGNLTTNGAVTWDTSAGSVGFGGSASTFNRVKIDGLDPAITVSGANYYKGIYVAALNQYNIASGITDSGYRIALDASAFVSDSDFLGTLNQQYAVWARHGANVSGVGSTITNSYGVYIDSLTTANTCITNLWGLYQCNSAAKNYFAGNVGIGTATPTGAKLQINHTDTGGAIKLYSTTYSAGVDLGGGAGYLNIVPDSTSGALFARDTANTTGYWVALGVKEVGNANQGDGFLRSYTDLHFETNNSLTPKVTVKTDGNVGINTVSPSQRFSVSETLTYNDSTRLLTVVNSGNAGGLEITGANGRIYFNGYRAIEGNTGGTIMTIAEGFSCANVCANLLVTQSSNLIIGGFGAIGTGGTLDWNDSSNARSGNGHTLLLGTATNGPGGSGYWHPFSFEYTSKDGTGNLSQLAIPYSSTALGIHYRTRYSGAWSSWCTIWTSANDGAGSGLHADCLDGQQGSYYDQSACSGLNCVGTVTNVASGTGLTGGPITGSGTLSLANSGVTPGTYGNACIAVDTYGRITSVCSGDSGTVTSVSSGTTNQLTVATGTSTPVLSIVTGAVADLGTALATGDQIHAFVTGQGYTTNTGTVTSVGSGTGLTGGPITGSGTLSLANSGVTPGTYGNACIAVDTYGRITSVCSGDSGTVTSVSSGTTNQLTVATGTSTPVLSIVTGAVADLGTALATGDQIYDFVTGQGYCTSNNYVTGASFGAVTDGVLTLTRSGLGNVTVDLDGRYCFDNDYLSSGSFNSSTGDLTLVSTGAVSDVIVNLDGRYCTSPATYTWGACVQNDTGTINHSTVAAGALTCISTAGCAITCLCTDAYGHVTGATIGCTTSDYRAKTNIQNYDIGYEAVKSVQTYSYTLKKEKEKGTQVGMMAHELQEAGVCFGVYGEKDQLDEKGNPKYQHVSYEQLVPTLWNALRKSICKIEILENKICKLESCVTILGQCVIE